MRLNHSYYIEPRTGDNHLELGGVWAYTYADAETDIGALEWELHTQVPSSLFWSLHRSGVLPHPYEGCNSKLYHWVDEKVWYYKKRFAVARESRLGDAFLCIDGASYYSRVWLNGSLLGSHEGMFGGPVVNVGDRLNYGGENELIIEIKACNFGKKDRWNPREDAEGNREIVPWNIVRDDQTSNGDFIVLGLWKGVRIEFLPKLHLGRPYLTTQEITAGQAKLHLQCEIADGTIDELAVEPDYRSGQAEYTRAFDDGLTGIEGDETLTVRVEVREAHSGAPVFAGEEQIRLYDYEKSGINPRFYECQFYRRTITIADPKLWYPQGMGDAFLYTVTVSLLKDGALLDALTWRHGIRTIALTASAGGQYRARWDKFQFVVNGEEIFLKGMNWAPVDFLYSITPQEYAWALELVKNAGIQLLRVWSGGGMPETDTFYDLCDAMGIMVWQDSFLANMDAPNWPQDILQDQVCMNLYRIRNHPSLAVHCGGNEFNPYSFGNAAAMFVIERNISDLDPARPFVRTTADKGSAHIYRDMEPTWYRHLYRQLPFIAESGIHSFPNLKSLRQLLSEEEYSRPLADPLSPAFRDSHPELLNHFTEYVPERIPRMLARASHISSLEGISLGGLVEATQIASCEFYQIMVQAARENFPVTTGIMPWVFKRPWTTVGIQLVDGMGDPIAPYYYVKNAYQPLAVMVCLAHLTVAPGDKIRLPVKVFGGGAGIPAGAELTLQVLDPAMRAVYGAVWEAGRLAADGQGVWAQGEFVIPRSFGEKFFFVRAALTDGSRVLCQSVYWPKCLTRMLDPATKQAYCAGPQPNLILDKGPWLKEQVAAAPPARLCVRLRGLQRSDSRMRVDFDIENISGSPAFPVRVDVAEAGAVCYANDNYFFQSAGEKRAVTLTIYDREPGRERLTLTVTAWNCGAVTKTILLKGDGACC